MSYFSHDLWVLYFTENAPKESELCIGRSTWVEILCPVLFVHWNLKNLNTFSKKTRFFPALDVIQCHQPNSTDGYDISVTFF